jgi:hypothetical protein
MRRVAARSCATRLLAIAAADAANARADVAVSNE